MVRAEGQIHKKGDQKAWLWCLIAVKCEEEQEKESKIISGIATWAEINSGRGKGRNKFRKRNHSEGNR